PSGRPLHDGVHQFMHAADRIHLFAAFAESGVYVDAGAGNADPHGTKMFEDNAEVGGLAENAHVGKYAMVNEIVSAEAIAAIFLALVLAPLRLFDFARYRSDDHVALEPDSCALQRFHGMGVTHQRALHVVDAQAINDAVLHNGMRFVADTCEEFFA